MKIHPNLKPHSKKELNKLMRAKIIFTIRYSQWVSNNVLVRKNNGDIRICIDFRNLGKAYKKDIFSLPPTE